MDNIKIRKIRVAESLFFYYAVIYREEKGRFNAKKIMHVVGFDVSFGRRCG